MSDIVSYSSYQKPNTDNLYNLSFLKDINCQGSDTLMQ